MSNDLSGILIAACLLAAIWTIALAAADRTVGNRLLIELGITELLVLIQLVVAVVEVAAGNQPDSTVIFLAYAVSEVLILPAGLFWSQSEKSRSSTLVITVAALAVAVMSVRMMQMWSTVS